MTVPKNINELCLVSKIHVNKLGEIRMYTKIKDFLVYIVIGLSYMVVGYILNTISISLNNCYIIGFPTDELHFYNMFKYLVVGSFLLAFVVIPISEKRSHKLKYVYAPINLLIIGIFMYSLFYNVYNAGTILSLIIGVGSAFYVVKNLLQLDKKSNYNSMYLKQFKHWNLLMYLIIIIAIATITWYYTR